MNINYIISSILLTISISSGAQNLYTDKDRSELYKGAYEGCLEKQNQGGLNKNFKPEVLPSFCTCAAKRITDDLLGNIEFQIAISKKNHAVMREVTDKESSKENTMKRFNYCIDKVKDDYGGMKNLFKNGTNDQSLSKAGLSGESRRSFIYGGTYECVEAAKKTNGFTVGKAEEYCSCSLNSMADKLSGDDLLEIAKESKAGRAIFRKVGSESARPCFNNLKGNGLSKNNENPLFEKLVGKWTLVDGWTYDFKSNGLGEITFNGSPVCGTFTYSLKGNVLTSSKSRGSCAEEKSILIIKIDGDVMISKAENSYVAKWIRDK